MLRVTCKFCANGWADCVMAFCVSDDAGSAEAGVLPIGWHVRRAHCKGGTEDEDAFHNRRFGRWCCDGSCCGSGRWRTSRRKSSWRKPSRGRPSWRLVAPWRMGSPRWLGESPSPWSLGALPAVSGLSDSAVPLSVLWRRSVPQRLFGGDAERLHPVGMVSGSPVRSSHPPVAAGGFLFRSHRVRR